MPRPLLHESTQDIMDRRQLEIEAEDKAANRPDELEEADLDHISPATMAELAHRGHLFKFGVPPQHR